MLRMTQLQRAQIVKLREIETAQQTGTNRERDRDDGKSQAERDRAEKKKAGGKGRKGDGAEEMSVEETNKLRAELGLPPLK
jgi:HIND motif